MTDPRPFAELTARQQREFYKRWIRSKPCVWCGSVRRVGSLWIDASHHNFSTKGPSGTALKSSDFRTVPLCEVCHRRLHKTAVLWDAVKYDVDRDDFRLEDESGAQESRDFLMRATIDLLVEFMETMLSPDTL